MVAMKSLVRFWLMFGNKSFKALENPIFVRKPINFVLMKRFLAYVFSFGTLVLLFASCERSAYYGMKEGSVVYDMELVGDKLDPMMKAMMPSEVTTYFADGKSCTVMEGCRIF